jgi:heat shock protein HslJ
MKASFVVIAIVTLGSLALAACVPAAAPTVPIANTAWILSTLNGKPVLANTTVTLAFETEKMGGSDGCNRYGGTYLVNSDKLKFDKNIVKTLMGCQQDILKQGDEFTTALTQTAAFRNDGQTLTLLDGFGKTLATFTAQSTKLGGTSWIVTGYNNGKQAVVSVLNGTQLTADFSEDGKLSGSAGCNRFTGGYEVTGSALKVGQLGVTRMFCGEPAGRMEQETQFLAALQGATTFRMEGSKLELRNADGALLVSAQRAP